MPEHVALWGETGDLERTRARLKGKSAHRRQGTRVRVETPYLLHIYMAKDEGLYLVVARDDDEAARVGSRGRLFLGTQKAAQDRSLLRRYAVSRIVCVGTPAFYDQQEENADGAKGGDDEGEVGNNGSDGTTGGDSTGGLVYLEVNIKDLPSENLLGRLDACVAFIENGMRRGESVLVNCVYAQSRSAAIVVAYICRTTGLSISQATDKVREAQPTVHINPGFEAQLQLYYDLGCRLPESKAIYEDAPTAYSAVVGEKNNATMAGATYRWFSFAKTAQEEGLCGWAASGAERRVASHGATYRCKACRAPLFRDSNILDHAHPLVQAASDSVYASFSRHGDGSSWLKARDAAAASSFSTNKEPRGAKGRYQPRAPPGRGAADSSCRSRGVGPSDERCRSCTSVFTEALDWVVIVDSTCSRDNAQSSGKITCPGTKGAAACGSKLGAWSLGGIACSCGKMVKPAIQFTLSRIERVQAF